MTNDEAPSSTARPQYRTRQSHFLKDYLIVLYNLFKPTKLSSWKVSDPPHSCTRPIPETESSNEEMWFADGKALTPPSAWLSLNPWRISRGKYMESVDDSMPAHESDEVWMFRDAVFNRTRWKLCYTPCKVDHIDPKVPVLSPAEQRQYWRKWMARLLAALVIVISLIVLGFSWTFLVESNNRAYLDQLVQWNRIHSVPLKKSSSTETIQITRLKPKFQLSKFGVLSPVDSEIVSADLRLPRVDESFPAFMQQL